MQFAFDAIGTRWCIDVFDVSAPIAAITLEKEVQDHIEQFDVIFSRFRKDSLVTKISQESGDYLLPAVAEDLFDLYKRLYDITDGIFTPLIGDALVALGYDATYSLRRKNTPTIVSWEEALSYTFPHLYVKKNVLLDFGAGGKGYLVDIIGRLLHKKGIASFCIDAGGDMLYMTSSEKPLRIGLEHPENTKQIIGIVPLLNKSICGSAGNRRTWDDVHHIIHPSTMTSPQDILAVWVIAETALLADALATCLFLVPPHILTKQFSFDYTIVYRDYSIIYSKHFPGEFFS